MKAALISAVIIAGMGLAFTFLIRAGLRNDAANAARCEAAGGTYVHGRDIRLCLKKDAIL